MTFKTFDQLDAEAGPGALFTPTAPRAEPTPAGYSTPDTLAKAQEIANRSTWGAAFRQDNTIGSLLSRKDLGVDNDNDPNFNPVDYIKANGLEGHEGSFYGVLNSRLADAKRDQIKMEQQDKETLDASGWLGTFAQIGAGVADLPTLIPGTVAVRGAAGGYSVARSVIMAGASAGATQAVTEGALHASQETRTLSESAVNIGGAMVLGSLLGAGAAAVLGKNERITAQKAIDSMADINSGRVPNAFAPEGAPGSAGAMANPHYTDTTALLNTPRSREEMGVDGTFANWVSRMSQFNPVLRGTQRYAASARQFADSIYENTIYRVMHSAGETTGQSVEAVSRTQVSAMLGQASQESEAAFAAMWKGAGVERLTPGSSADGTRLSKDAFYDAVGVAMRNKDESDNPFVAQAARSYRKMFDHFTDQAIKLGILDPEDLDVKTAASYFSRMWNRDVLSAQQADFMDTIGKHYAEGMAKSYAEDATRMQAVRAKWKQQIDDIGQVGEARAARLQEIADLAKQNDAVNPAFLERAGDLREARGAVRGTEGDARAAAQARVKQIEEEGGPEFKAFMDAREELNRRRRNLTERSPDAQTAWAERLQRRIDEGEARAERSMEIYGKQAKNYLNRLASDPAGRADELVARTEKEIGALRERAAQQEARANETKAQYLEAMDPQAGFDEAAGRAAREGATGEQAIRAGTKEADRITKQIADAERAVADLRRTADRLKEINKKLAKRETARDAANELVAELEEGAKKAAKQRAARSLRQGEEQARLKAEAAKLSPEEVAKRLSTQTGKFDAELSKVENAFDTRWGEAKAKGLERGEAYDFEAAGRDVARQVLDTLLGHGAQSNQVPGFIVPIKTGPLKDRTFLVPDELVAGKGWLKNDVRQVGERYARQMAGANELKRRYPEGLQPELQKIRDEYNDMQVAASRATTTKELNDILGRNAFGARRDLDRAKLETAKMLDADLRSALTDSTAGWEKVLGTYGAGVGNTNFASIVRSATAFNYITKLGGVSLSSVTEFYRPAMVHGLLPYLRHLPDHISAALPGGGSRGLNLSIKEAQLSGVVLERVNHAMAASIGDVGDPFITKTTGFERMMQKAARGASRWNLINYITDSQQAMFSTLSQHRIMEAALGNGAKDGSFVVGKDTRLLRRLGIDEATQRDIAEFVTKHGETIDGIRVANTEQWLMAARETGLPSEISRAENAVRTYRTALNTDVNRGISRRGLGDAPLFADTPVGKLMLQFSGYSMGAHSRYMITGMQEDKMRFLGGIIGMSTMGAAASYLSAWRAGEERWQKYTKEIRDNPAKLIGEGLDRGGLFPLLFDVSNRIEKITGGVVGQDAKVNPLKSPIAMLGGGSPVGATSTRGSDSSGPIGAIFGPTAGLLDSVVAAGRVGADKARGLPSSKRDLSLATAAMPYNSYPIAREAIQILQGNSPWMRR